MKLEQAAVSCLGRLSDGETAAVPLQSCLMETHPKSKGHYGAEITGINLTT